MIISILLVNQMFDDENRLPSRPRFTTQAVLKRSHAIGLLMVY
jgi:hypothetical protein